MSENINLKGLKIFKQELNDTSSYDINLYLEFPFPLFVKDSSLDDDIIISFISKPYKQSATFIKYSFSNNGDVLVEDPYKVIDSYTKNILIPKKLEENINEKSSILDSVKTSSPRYGLIINSNPSPEQDVYLIKEENPQYEYLLKLVFWKSALALNKIKQELSLEMSPSVVETIDSLLKNSIIS